MAQNYIKALLGTAERKNGRRLAEYLGKKTPYAIQRFLYRGRFSADEIIPFLGRVDAIQE
jgi:hypothetical protein